MMLWKENIVKNLCNICLALLSWAEKRPEILGKDCDAADVSVVKGSISDTQRRLCQEHYFGIGLRQVLKSVGFLGMMRWVFWQMKDSVGVNQHKIHSSWQCSITTPTLYGGTNVPWSKDCVFMHKPHNSDKPKLSKVWFLETKSSDNLPSQNSIRERGKRTEIQFMAKSKQKTCWIKVSFLLHLLLYCPYISAEFQGF